MARRRSNDESLASYIKGKTGSSEYRLSLDKYCIFRTPSILASHNKEAFTPYHISIGPFHHDEPNLKGEKIKIEYLIDFLSRSSKNPEDKWAECLDSIRNMQARDCYAENLQLADKDFAEMLMADGCFIIELFRKFGEVVPLKYNDPIFSLSCMLQFLHHDLVLLENQIPWFVLELLFNKIESPPEKSLLQLALQFFSCMFKFYAETTDLKNDFEIYLELFEKEEVKHILHLLWLMLVVPAKEVKAFKGKNMGGRDIATNPFCD